MITRWLFPRLYAARLENHRLHEIITYQHGRMRDMSAALLKASPAERRDASALLLAGRVEAAKVRPAVCRTIIRDGGSS